MNQLKEFRKQKDVFFEKDPHSPLSMEQKQDFQGLRYYPENPALIFETKLKSFDEQKQIQMQTSTGEIKEYTRSGKFQFDVDSLPAELTVYTSQDGSAFVPFKDKTTANETYGAGRYLELEHRGEDLFEVDFNQAYNPWCAYSPDYSCPFPPEENRLSVPILAGEKNFN